MHDLQADAVTLPLGVLDDMLEKAAERGARRALESVGLSDPDAINDVRGLRGLMQAYRVMRASALREFGKGVAYAILAFVAWVLVGKYLPK